jgi:hypothetical protein
LNNHLKTIQQKIAQIKVPEFNEKVKEGFLNSFVAMRKTPFSGRPCKANRT